MKGVKMLGLFDIMMSDQQVGLLNPCRAGGTKNLVEHLPKILEDKLRGHVTVSHLMKAQHHVLEFLLTAGEEVVWLTDLSDTVADWRDAELFLDLQNKTAEDFFRYSFLSESDIERVGLGQLTLGELLQAKPQAFLAPMLRSIKHTRH